MKRLSAILLILFYSVSVFGFTINRLYCCGKLADVSLSAAAVCKMEHKTGDLSCCKSVKTTLKVKDNHVAARTEQSLKNTFAIVTPVFFLPASSEGVIQSAWHAYNSKAPPCRQRLLYILYANYRI
ncbi:HYC_CC_PP family protein [Mucilaginibacter gossypiicola]|uniref:HYC_CC_PP family protein n=1 Tax=Mucilaginibacter gossypiicola TaxID=551995 RepID=UPI000B814183|nr:hypothetical protein [Mucilaginibacter gossypiicola]